MFVIILGSTDCVVCLWYFLVLLSVWCACGIPWFYSLCGVHVAFLGSTLCVVCLWHCLVLLSVLCACGIAWF